MTNENLVADRIEIADLYSRFGLLLDEQRWDDADTVFADDVAVQSSRAGDLHGIDQLVDFMRGAEVEGEHTQHTHTDLLVDIDGDQAESVANSVVYYFREGRPPHKTGGLRVACTVVRKSAGWRFSDVRVTPVWILED